MDHLELQDFVNQAFPDFDVMSAPSSPDNDTGVSSSAPTVGYTPSLISDIVVPEIVPETKKYLRPDQPVNAYRGMRSGWYTKTIKEYNSIKGINQEDYDEILAALRITYFGQAIGEHLRPKMPKKVEVILEVMKIKLPSTQRLNLLSQLWLDLCTETGPEEEINHRLWSRVTSYRQKFEDMHKRPISFWDKVNSFVTKVITFGLVQLDQRDLPRA